jgi:N-acetylglutamate synthase-like GNAT family acetyltransferase
MRTRKAILPDAKHIHELISAYSGDGTLLPARWRRFART